MLRQEREIFFSGEDYELATEKPDSYDEFALQGVIDLEAKLEADQEVDDMQYEIDSRDPEEIDDVNTYF